MKPFLIACEESQEICKSFRERGFECYSCDILDCSGNHKEWHIKGDVLSIINGGNFKTMDGKEHYVKEWGLIIAHPPCTDLAVSGARWFKDKLVEQGMAVQFFMALVNSPIERICVENPISIMSTKYRKPDQIIQPWQFGHGETKKTGLWKRNLPDLRPTNVVSGRSDRIHKLPPSPDRGKIRSKTYQGIADAIADQWGNLL